jgi:NarL family two-component system response regulator LiaR
VKVIVCDDEPVIRGVVSKLATNAGHDVIAETDSGPSAVEMVLRFRPEVLIMDLALAWGAGTQAIRDLREAGSPVEIVLFTSWAADSPEVRAADVRAVIEKPDIAALEQVLDDLAAGLVAESPAGTDRRSPVRPRPSFPPHGRVTASGLEDPETFQDAVLDLVPGDAVLVVHVAGIENPVDWFERVAATDLSLSVAAMLRSLVRVQDRLAVRELSDDEQPRDLVVLVLAGRRAGAEAVWRRIETAHEQSDLPGVVSGGWAMCDEGVVGPMAVSRAADAARRSIGRPPGERLWAG